MQHTAKVSTHPWFVNVRWLHPFDQIESAHYGDEKIVGIHKGERSLQHDDVAVEHFTSASSARTHSQLMWQANSVSAPHSRLNLSNKRN